MQGTARASVPGVQVPQEPSPPGKKPVVKEGSNRGLEGRREKSTSEVRGV